MSRGVVSGGGRGGSRGVASLAGGILPVHPAVPRPSPQGNGRRQAPCTCGWMGRKGSPSQTGQNLAWARGWVYLDGQESGAVSESGTAEQRLRGRVRGSGYIREGSGAAGEQGEGWRLGARVPGWEPTVGALGCRSIEGRAPAARLLSPLGAALPRVQASERAWYWVCSLESSWPAGRVVPAYQGVHRFALAPP